MSAALWFVAITAAVGVPLFAVLAIRRGGRPAVFPGSVSVAELLDREDATSLPMYPSPVRRESNNG
ncbi:MULTISPECIES: hypothetical protein [unclassified Crossiella]|uniref:hypothetical protein n=1 Tax=unclassified Crossiella TaxID=2620835 RepID=UPI001FFE5674|nr:MULTISPECIES: hypothetical protein [unclassified Crossiella]MCK2242130.1 hypothetical protein [Crossiella sp. S99.2]MCK2256033.1 hypothetical protein [Crossiella sp. S99.1]